VTRRRHTPLHDFWHPRVEGQIRDAIHSHPEWFNLRSEGEKRTMVNSVAERIVGEIAAALGVAAAVLARAAARRLLAAVPTLPPAGRGMVSTLFPSRAPSRTPNRSAT
jgi:hypothetical protein